MKRIVLSLAVVVAMTMSISAQDKQTKEKSNRLDRPMPLKELNLTAEQEQQMKSLHESYLANKKELNENYQKDVMKILTPEQQSKWEKIEKSKLEKGKKNRKKDTKSKKRSNNKGIDKATKDKLNALKSDYEAKKSAIEKTRIAPEVQKQQLQELEKQYKADRYSILQSISGGKK